MFGGDDSTTAIELRAGSISAMRETTMESTDLSRRRDKETDVSLDFVFIASIFFVLHCIMSASSAGHFVFSHAM